MKLLVYKKDIVTNPLINIDNLSCNHIIHGTCTPQLCDVVIFIDGDQNRFKILKHRESVEFVGCIIEDLSNLENFI